MMNESDGLHVVEVEIRRLIDVLQGLAGRMPTRGATDEEVQLWADEVAMLLLSFAAAQSAPAHLEEATAWIRSRESFKGVFGVWLSLLDQTALVDSHLAESVLKGLPLPPLEGDDNRGRALLLLPAPWRWVTLGTERLAEQLPTSVSEIRALVQDLAIVERRL